MQGRESAADALLEEARALEAAGVFGVVMEIVPTEAARRVTETILIPIVGIGVGVDCDAQVLV